METRTDRHGERRSRRTAAIALICLLLPFPAAAQPDVAGNPKKAEFGRERTSRDARETADRVVVSGDNRGKPFLIIDKAAAKLFVFDPSGKLRGAAPVLLGSARGDDTVPGIGDKPLSQVKPEERTTPAGRFVAKRGHNLSGEDIIWVDYDAAVSIHRVRANVASQRRLERLASPTPNDNRISFGCINVPARFYDDVVNTAFNGTDAIVYVLPETRPARTVFGSYDVGERSRGR